MNTPSQRAPTDLILGVLASALVLLPLPVLLTVDAQDLLRLALLMLLVLPAAIFAAIAHKRPVQREMHAEVVRIRR